MIPSPNWFDVLTFLQGQIPDSNVGLFGVSRVTEELSIVTELAVETLAGADISIESDNKPKKSYRWDNARLFKFRENWFIEYPLSGTRVCRVTRQIESEHKKFLESALINMLEMQLSR